MARQVHNSRPIMVPRAQALRGRAPTPQAIAEAHARARRARQLWAGALIIAAGSVATVFQSCSGKKPGDVRDAAAVADNRGRMPRSAAAENLERKAMFDQAATDLQALFDTLHRAESGDPDPADLPSDAAVTGGPGRTASPPAAALPSGPATPEPEPVSPPTPPAPVTPTIGSSETSSLLTPDGRGWANVPASLDGAAPIGGVDALAAAAAEKRRAELAGELASLLSPSRQGGGNTDVLQALAPLLALEAVQPGAATLEIEGALKNLTPDEAAAVKTVRDLLRRLGDDHTLTADPRALADELRSHLDRLSASAAASPLSLGTVALCTRVESFGRYRPLESCRMLAGRSNAAIVYVEVEDFVQQRAGDAGDFTVQLEQQIELWYDDGSRQWRAPAATIRDSSRTRRNDFFLVQRIDLPANLSVGKYNLKVTVRDLGAAGSPQAESIVPIEIIADQSLIGGASRPLTKGQAAEDPAASVAAKPPIPVRTAPVVFPTTGR